MAPVANLYRHIPRCDRRQDKAIPSLLAISTLEEGVAVHYDIAEDFAVLCSNCHRMIHRSRDPSDLDAFRALVQSNES